MKRVFIIGFRGVGFRNAEYKNEPLLIRAGHVGFSFEGEEDIVLGFRPTEEASERVGDDNAIIQWLRDHYTMVGRIHDDTAIFQHA